MCCILPVLEVETRGHQLINFLKNPVYVKNGNYAPAFTNN